MEQIPTSRVARGGKLAGFAAKQAAQQARLRFARFTSPQDVADEAVAQSFLDAANDLVRVLGGMKGAAMKIGQMLSIIDIEIVPAEHRERFRQQLAVLRDSAPSVPFDAMRHMIEEDLGCGIDDAFAEFNPHPIAAASIGQVYKARLHDGRQVAVKVQYPKVAAAVRADLKNLALMLKLSKPLVPTFSTQSFIDEIHFHLEEELDYLVEAQTQHELASFYAGHPAILVPDVALEWCRSRVLVNDFVEGRAFGEICDLPASVRDRVGEIVYRFYIGGMYLDNQFNGDSHPGNVLLADDARVAFIDFGLFKRMDPAAVDFARMSLRLALSGAADELHDLMRINGVLRRDAEISPADLLAYAYAASPWTFDDDELQMTPELAGGAFMSSADPRAIGFGSMRRESLPHEHFFARRADFYTAGILGQLRARANWHRIAREWAYSDPPATDLGRADAHWRAHRTI